VVARDWRCPAGEIDLVAWREGVLVFCEVKARTSAAFGSAAESVTPRQLRRVRAAAREFLARGEVPGLRPRLIRFDVACVDAGDVSVIENAF
jgi:putative endonuclease